MGLKIKKIKIEIGIIKVEDGIALEIELDNDIYRLVKKEENLQKKEPSETIKKKNLYIIRKPKRALRYEPTYHCWVTKDHVIKVKQAIGLGLKTFDEIKLESGLSINRCRATLKYLKMIGELKNSM